MIMFLLCPVACVVGIYKGLVFFLRDVQVSDILRRTSDARDWWLQPLIIYYYKYKGFTYTESKVTLQLLIIYIIIVISLL